ncbi:MAG TPA: NTP transferase domain-containing protein [Solirubrobacteraceae bacterium]|nr:NTP transferase domain-containing protein [Solirubrobacteraceae bacterium]
MLAGVIPAAGHGTRLGRRDGSKELVPVRGRPVMDLLVERMRAAGVDELRIVTRPEKPDVMAYARELGARLVLGHPRDVAASLLLGLAGLANDDEVVFGFPDALWEPPDGYARVLAALRAGADVALGLFRTTDLERSDVVVCDADGTVSRIAVKPETPPGDRIWGIAAARAGTLRGLREGTEPGVTFDGLARRGRVVGVPLSDDWLDVGTPEALERARRR